jgi:redox-sensitive bicupin YhaK (pirin superfamily)
MYLDFRFAPNTTFSQAVPKEWNAFIYILTGDLIVGEDTQATEAHHTVVSANNCLLFFFSFGLVQRHTLSFVLSFYLSLLNTPDFFLFFIKRQVLSTGGDYVQLTSGSAGAHFVLIAGQPLNEPVAQAGPFVMNTDSELRQTFLDYQTGRNGFERAVGWKSQAVRESGDFGSDDE